MDAFVHAKSKAEAVARIYALAGARPEPLGPGSKEKKSALLALSEAAGVAVPERISKTELVRALAAEMSVDWSDRFVSVGETVTLDGLNALLRAVSARLSAHSLRPGVPEWLTRYADFTPARTKLEAVNRISALTGSGPQALGPGSKERKSVLSDLARAWYPELDVGLSKHDLGAALADRLGVAWPSDCVSTGYTVTLDGLNTLLAAAEAQAKGLAVEPEAAIAREAAALVGALRSTLPSHWEGRAAITEMRSAEYANWRQSEWPGWYFEFRGLPALIDSFGGGPQRIGRTTFDYALTMPWDLKCHSLGGSSSVVLNDHASVMEGLAHGPLGFLMLAGDAQLDPPAGEFTHWVRAQTRSSDTGRIGGLSGRPRLRKRSFTPRSLEAYVLRDLSDYEGAILAGKFLVRGQGRQQSGAPRPNKLYMNRQLAARDATTRIARVDFVPPNGVPITYESTAPA
ncbi:hypothetical protein [Agrococcus sediminis]|uniref:hypothetical protein n=1 Tax=Agrococcus sediminis TaxID=2599924 RepID=UPI003427A1E2